jgi:hypothetical protein
MMKLGRRFGAWTNAFGTSKKRAAEIAAYLKELFADQHFGAGKPVGPQRPRTGAGPLSAQCVCR